MSKLLIFFALLTAIVLPAEAGPKVRMAALPDGHVAYIDEGAGDAVILIHGLGADLSRWEANIDALAQTHRVIALDLYGFGASARLDGDYRAQVFVDQVDALRAYLNLDTESLIGNSMGGWVAMLYAEQNPEAVEKLVLVAPAFVFGLPEHVKAEQLAAGASPDTFEAMEAYLSRVYAYPPTDLKTVSALLAEHREKNAGDGIASMATSIKAGEDTLTPERFAKLAAATFFIHGDSDGIVPVEASVSLADMMPNAALQVYEGIGHWPQEEAASTFNADVSRFLAALE